MWRNYKTAIYHSVSSHTTEEGEGLVLLVLLDPWYTFIARFSRSWKSVRSVTLTVSSKLTERDVRLYFASAEPERPRPRCPGPGPVPRGETRGETGGETAQLWPSSPSS